ncbi:MAG: hypothetical protein OXL41_03915 [Nitrospinae bacterium]|nr:hypothetical protein [Nitrospinota bacterium]
MLDKNPSQLVRLSLSIEEWDLVTQALELQRDRASLAACNHIRQGEHETASKLANTSFDSEMLRKRIATKLSAQKGL